MDEPKNRIRHKQHEEEQKELAMALLSTARRFAMDSNTRVMGQVMIASEGMPEFPVVLYAKGDGAYLFWTRSLTHFHLYSLVNEERKEVVSFPLANAVEFQAKLKELQDEFGE